MKSTITIQVKAPQYKSILILIMLLLPLLLSANEQTPKEVVTPIINLLIKGKYKDAALLEKYHLISDKTTLTIDGIAKKYQEEYSGKLNDLDRFYISQKNTTTGSRILDTKTSLVTVTVLFVFKDGAIAETEYHLIKNEDSKWNIDPYKTTLEWNIDPTKKRKTKKNIQGGFNSDLYDIHLSDFAPKLTDIINLHLSAYTVEVLTFIILGLSIIMHLLRRYRDEDEGFEGLQLPIFGISFITICVLELINAMSGINPLWFCSPNTIGWFLSVIGFFSFVYILYNQLKCFQILMNEITVVPGFYSYGLPAKKYLTGIISGCIGILALYLCSFLETEMIKTAFWSTASVIALLQIFQAVIIYKNMETLTESLGLIKSKREQQRISIKKSLISIVYLIATFATIVTLMYFMALFFVAIIIIIVWAILFIMGKAQQSSAGKSVASSLEKEDILEWAYCNSCMYYPGYGRNCNYNGKSMMVNDNTKACRYYRRD